MPCQEKDLREIGIPIRITSAVTASFIAGKHRKRFLGLLDIMETVFSPGMGQPIGFQRRYVSIQRLGFD
jgi:hypothetical protein